MKKYFFPLLIVLAACDNSSPETNSSEKEKQSIVVNLKEEAEMDDRVNEIDAIVEASGLVANSLRYDKGDGIFVEVQGYMDSKNVILKFVEEFSDGNGKNNGRRIYYINNGKPFVTREIYDEVINQQGSFVDRISYYDKNGKVIKTKEKRAGFEGDADKLPYTSVALQGLTIDRVYDVMNSKKEFATTFQGFADAGPMTYMILGEDKPDGYTSTLRLDYKDQLIRTLTASPESFIGEELQVNFQVHEDQGFEFQVYAGGQFVNEDK